MIHMTPPDVEGARYHFGKCIQLGGEPDAALAAALKAPGPDAPTAPDSVTPQTKPDAPTPVTTAPEPDLDSTEGAEGEEPERKSWLRSILPW